MESSTPIMRRNRIFGVAVLGLAALIAAYTFFATRTVDERGAALVGGPFTMVNHRGETVTEKTFLGKPMLVFFGFTYCPDVCPSGLQVMTAALNDMGEAGKDIQPVFVTIDPERDTPVVLASYVSNFSDTLVGLTGTPTQVAHIASIFRVAFEKRENKADPGNYLMDHSSFMLLMGADGKFIKHFSYTTDAALLADNVKKALNRD
jgi:cytochrome oxidase Cu insertion factor (SCO1/SenC/PrrC family)